MNRSTLIRLAAMVSLCAAAAPRLCAQTAAIVASPSTLTFDLRPGIPTQQQVSLSLVNTAVTSFVVTLSATAGLRVPSSATVPGVINVTVDNPSSAGLAGEVFVSGGPTLSTRIPVCYIRTSTSQCQGGTGTGTFQASPASLTFTQTGTVAPVAAQISLLSSTGVLPTYVTNVTYTSGTTANWLQVSPAPGTPSTAQVLTVTPFSSFLTTGTYTATITVQPQTSGYNTVNIPVTLTVGGGTGTGNFQASPASLTFTQTGTINPSPAQISLFASTGFLPTYVTNVAYTSGTTASWLQLSPAPGTPSNSQLITVTPFTSFLTNGTYTATITVQPQTAGFNTISIPVTLTVGTGTGTGTFQASPTSVIFTQTSSSPPLPAQISLFSSTGIVPIYTTNVAYTSGATTNWLQLSPAAGTSSSSQVITVTPFTSFLTAGTYTATITVLPQSGGINSISIPVTLTITGTGGSGFYANPGSLTFTPALPTQSLTINAGTSTQFSVSPSTTIASFVAVNPLSGTAAPTATVTVTVSNPSAVPANTTGFLTITPLSSSYAAFTVPVQINPSGSTSGSLIVSPTSLTFATTPGATAPQSQLLNVTSATGAQQLFSVSASSTNNFLTAFASSSATPATITVGINPSAISQAGTYQGFVTITPSTGTGANVPITVPVTVNVGTTGAIFPTPTSLSLTGQAGSSQVATGQVRLDVGAGIPAVAFTAVATTTSGGDWLSVSGAGTAPGLLTVNASPASLGAGTYQGKVTVTPAGSTAFDIAVTFTVSGSGEIRVSPTALTFAHQTAATPPPAQTVQVTSTGTPLTWNATATSSGNWLQISPATGTTGTNALSVSVNPTGLAPNSYTGTISVSSPNATGSAQTITVTLTVTTPVIPQVTQFSNAASFVASQASPGLIATITGTDLGPVTAAIPSAGFPTTLGETRVLFDGQAAPLLYTSATQVSTIAPFELAGRVTTRVSVEYRGQRSRELELRVTEAAPGVFTLNMSGSGQGAVLNQNGSVNGTSNPERRGNVVVIYATGLGSVFPSITTGAVASTASQTTTPVRVRIGGVDAPVMYSGAAPGLVGGGYQVNAVIPESVTPGSAVPVTIEAGIGLSQPAVTIAVQ